LEPEVKEQKVSKSDSETDFDDEPTPLTKDDLRKLLDSEFGEDPTVETSDTEGKTDGDDMMEMLNGDIEEEPSVIFVEDDDVEAETEEPEENVLQPGDVIVDDLGIRRILLPENISKKRYNRKNRHLPKALYEEDLDNYLYNAAAKNKIEGIRSLIDGGRNPDTKHKSGNTPLIAAVFNHHIDATRLLLLKKADPDLANTNELTPLHIAVYNGDDAIVMALLDAGANVNLHSRKGSTPLMSAVLAGNLRMTGVLLNGGAEVNAQNKDGYTALHIAAHSGRTDIIQALLNKKANPHIEGGQGLTAEDLAVSSRQFDAAKLIRKAIPYIDAMLGSDYLLDQLDREVRSDNDKGWYLRTASQLNYDLLPDEDKIIWEQLLSDWIEADKNFDSLSDEDKKIWNEKRKVLQLIFGDHFIAYTPEDQLVLDEYMKKWEDLDKPPEVIKIAPVPRVIERPSIPAPEPVVDPSVESTPDMQTDEPLVEVNEADRLDAARVILRERERQNKIDTSIDIRRQAAAGAIEGARLEAARIVLRAREAFVRAESMPSIEQWEQESDTPPPSLDKFLEDTAGDTQIIDEGNLTPEERELLKLLNEVKEGSEIQESGEGENIQDVISALEDELIEGAEGAAIEDITPEDTNQDDLPPSMREGPTSMPDLYLQVPHNSEEPAPTEW